MAANDGLGVVPLSEAGAVESIPPQDQMENLQGGHIQSFMAPGDQTQEHRCWAWWQQRMGLHLGGICAPNNGIEESVFPNGEI